MTPDPWLGPVLLLAVIGIVCGLLAIGAGLVWFADKYPAWRSRRRRLKRLRTIQSYDSRFVNSVHCRDWRMDERVQKLLREAA